MGQCDVIKAFFMNVKHIEQRIMARMDEYDRCFELATRITPSYTGQPGGGNNGDSKVENGALMMANILAEMDKEIAAFRDYRRLARRVIGMIGDPRYADVLTLRYFNGYTWDKICEVMRYENTQVWRIHGYALIAADRAMQSIIEKDAQAKEIYEKIKDGIECNTPSVL